jgi:hypothetical protein
MTKYKHKRFMELPALLKKVFSLFLGEVSPVLPAQNTLYKKNNSQENRYLKGLRTEKSTQKVYRSPPTPAKTSPLQKDTKRGGIRRLWEKRWGEGGVLLALLGTGLQSGTLAWASVCAFVGKECASRCVHAWPS